MRRTTDKVHVNVQLIDARADAHLWAESYDRELKDVFAVEGEVSQKIANSLQAKLGSPRRTRAEHIFIVRFATTRGRSPNWKRRAPVFPTILASLN